MSSHKKREYFYVFISSSRSKKLKEFHALVEGGTPFLVPGRRLEFCVRALRPAGSSLPGPRLGAGFGLWLSWTLI